MRRRRPQRTAGTQRLPRKLGEANLRMLAAHGRARAGAHGFVPLDIDTSPMDNSGTQREGGSWTYKKFDGYQPIFAYLGEQGYMIAQELRPGSQHAQNGFVPFLKNAVAAARRLSDEPLPGRLDAAEQEDQQVPRLREIEPVVWPVMDAKLLNTLPHRPAVTKVPAFQAGHSRADDGPSIWKRSRS